MKRLKIFSLLILSIFFTLFCEKVKSQVVYAGEDQAICADSTFMQANNPYPATGFWTVVGGAGIFENSTLYNTKVRGLGVGANRFRWSVNSLFDEVTITSNSVVTSAGNSQNICDTSAILNAVMPSLGATGIWTCNIPQVIIENPTSYNTLVRNLAFGENIFTWTVSSETCSSSAEMIVLKSQVPAHAGNDEITCDNWTHLAANNPQTFSPTAKGKWTVDGGTGIFENSTLFNTRVSNIAFGTNNYRWTVTNQNCESTDVITVVNNQILISAGADRDICADSTFLQAENPYPATGFWTLVGGGGIFENSTLYNTAVKQLRTGANRFRWTVIGNACTGSSEVTITNQNFEVYAGKDTEVVINSVRLEADDDQPAGSTREWSIVNGAGNFREQGNRITTVTQLGEGYNVFRWTVTNLYGCTAFDNVQVIYKNISANAGNDQLLCENSTQLQGNEILNATGKWFLVSGKVKFQNQTLYNTIIDSVARGENQLTWCVTKNGQTLCDTVKIFNNTFDANAGLDTFTCKNYISLNAILPDAAKGKWSVVLGSAVFENDSIQNTKISELAQGYNTFRWSVTRNGCTTYDDVTVIAESLPNAEFIISPKQQTEPNKTFTIENPNPTTQYNYYLWDMGDGIGRWLDSTFTNITYTYSKHNNGKPYFVTLEVRNKNCKNVKTDSLFLMPYTSVSKLRNIENISIFPNPVKSECRISFNLTKSQFVEISIFDVQGKIVKQLLNEKLDSRFYEIFWNGTNNANTETPNGIYFVKIKTLNSEEMIKISLMR